jgi:hypothetical protein
MTTADDDADVARVVRAAIAPGHDGGAELVVEVLYPSGGSATFALGAEPAMAIVDAAGISDIADLVGRPWQVLVGGREGMSKLTRGS